MRYIYHVNLLFPLNVSIFSNFISILSVFVTEKRKQFPNLNDEAVNALTEQEFPSWFEKYVCLLNMKITKQL